MDLDLSMVRRPQQDLSGYPEKVRNSPGYFRGVPPLLYASGVLNGRGWLRARQPKWPPDGLDSDRGHQLEQFCADEDDDRPLDPAPTPRELRLLRTYLEAKARWLATPSRQPGKVPLFKFRSNDGWHVLPEECIAIADALRPALSAEWDDPEEFELTRGFVAFNELAARHGGYEVW